MRRATSPPRNPRGLHAAQNPPHPRLRPGGTPPRSPRAGPNPPRRVGFGAALALALLPVGLLCGCGPARRAGTLPFLADQYSPSSSPGVLGHEPAPLADGADGDVRWQVVTAPDGKQYRLQWRSLSESVGKPGAGALRDGCKLPEEGMGYRHIGKHPYGTDETVVYVQYAAWATARLFPGTAPVVVGDISRDGGGRLPPHRSHGSGRDVDIGFYMKGNRSLRWFETAKPGELDLAKTWTLLEALIRTGVVQYIFVDRRIQEELHAHARSEGFGDETLGTLFQYPGSRSGALIRHTRGHTNHLHVRFRCPVDDDDCEG